MSVLLIFSFKYFPTCISIFNLTEDAWIQQKVNFKTLQNNLFYFLFCIFLHWPFNCSIHLFNFICSRGKQFSLAISFLLLNLSEWRIFQFKTFKQNQKLIAKFLKIFSIISKPFNFSVKSLFTIFQLLYTFIKSPKIPAEEILFHSIHFKVSKNFVDLSNIIFQFTTFSTRKFL